MLAVSRQKWVSRLTHPKALAITPRKEWQASNFPVRVRTRSNHCRVHLRKGNTFPWPTSKDSPFETIPLSLVLQHVWTLREAAWFRKACIPILWQGTTEQRLETLEHQVSRALS